jgi:hypothetical protein
MRRIKIGRRTLLSAPILACVALSLPSAASAAGGLKAARQPSVATGAVTHVRGTAATLVGTVNPRSFATTYNFEYGPTVAYGKRTVAAALPAGVLRVKVGQAVTAFLPGYHYRLVATNQAGTTLGKDRTFTLKSSRTTKFVLPKSTTPTVFGSPFVLSGTLTGAGNANRKLVLQSSPYPYLTPFATIGLPIVTDAAGRFVFRVASLSASTQFRVSTLDPRPVYSPVVTQKVAVRVLLKVRTTRHVGLVRLYGTVTPAVVGSHLSIQLRKPVRPGGKSERTTKFASQFSTVVKRGTKTTARFSTVVSIRHAGRYRAYVQVNKGALVSGSSASIVLRAAPASTHKTRHSKR